MSEGRLLLLSDGPLSVDAAVAAVQRPEAGGIAIFIGTVRAENEGHPVALLEYEAYAPMVARELGLIADEIEREINGSRVAVLHRTGRLEIGDIAVVCAASAPHRDAAFRACRALIDRVKERLPIWKREHGPDGPYWIGWEDARTVGP